MRAFALALSETFVPSDSALLKAIPPENTFARCGTYSSSLEIICKNGLHFAIRYPPLRFQAKLERVLYIV